MQSAPLLSGEQHKARRFPAKRHRRDSVAKMLDRIDSAYDGCVDRGSAQQEGMPRTTIRYHQQRRKRLEAESEESAFFESEAGIRVLHRLQTALHYVFSFIGPGGTRLVSLFLHLTKLSSHVAASRESQRQVAKDMQAALCAFGDEQADALASSMEPKEITVAQDETFHPQTCLVAMEPVSGYILLEKYTDKRDATTWNEAMKEALRSLPVRIIQSTGDEAKGIRAHVEQNLGAHHSPDLFHVQHETARSMSAPLAARIRKAEKAAAEASAAVEQTCHQAYLYQHNQAWTRPAARFQGPGGCCHRGRGRRPAGFAEGHGAPGTSQAGSAKYGRSLSPAGHRDGSLAQSTSFGGGIESRLRGAAGDRNRG